MYGLAEIEAMNNKIVSYTHKTVIACRAHCNKRCCINCDHFLSAEVNAFDDAGKLSDLVCEKREGKIQTWSGANECGLYLIPQRRH